MTKFSQCVLLIVGDFGNLDYLIELLSIYISREVMVMRKVKIYQTLGKDLFGGLETKYHMDSTNEFGHVFQSEFLVIDALVDSLDEMLSWEKTSKEYIDIDDAAIEEYIVINSRFLGVERTAAKYCGECQRDFYDGEVIYFTCYENRFFCSKCQVKLNERVDPEYLDWKLRKIDLKL